MARNTSILLYRYICHVSGHWPTFMWTKSYVIHKITLHLSTKYIQIGCLDNHISPLIWFESRVMVSKGTTRPYSPRHWRRLTTPSSFFFANRHFTLVTAFNSLDPTSHYILLFKRSGIISGVPRKSLTRISSLVGYDTYRALFYVYFRLPSKISNWLISFVKNGERRRLGKEIGERFVFIFGTFETRVDSVVLSTNKTKRD